MVVMVAVGREVMERLFFGILYADCLLLMTDSMEELQMKFYKWKRPLRGRG